MNVYFVEPDDLIRELSLDQLTRACQPVVTQLVERYGLRGKTLMSVGSGGSHEEAALLHAGMRRAFLFDIDEYGTIEPVLRRINRPERRADAPFVYFIDDFTKVQPDSGNVDPIDLLYFSGFTPDEARRGEISERHRNSVRTPPAPTVPISKKKPSWLGWLFPANTPLQAEEPVRQGPSDPDWPANVSPLHDIVHEAIDRFLAPGGLVIVQSYYAGVDVLQNPNYVALWKRVLADLRVDLLEVYHFAAASAVTLWVGQKWPDENSSAALTAKELERRPQITRFHARAQLEDCSVAKLNLSA